MCCRWCWLSSLARSSSSRRRPSPRCTSSSAPNKRHFRAPVHLIGSLGMSYVHGHQHHEVRAWLAFARGSTTGLVCLPTLCLPRCRDMFERMDENQSGALSSDELTAGLLHQVTPQLLLPCTF